MYCKRKVEGVRGENANKLENTLKELFSTFFPGKHFEGATADEFGNIEFPVTVGDTQHDMNDLSSGEKEILYGYLKLRRSAWKDSIILIDGTDQNSVIHLYTDERDWPEARSARGRGVSNNARARQRPWISAVSARADSRAA